MTHPGDRGDGDGQREPAGRPSQREMLATYFGLREPPQRRPDWRADLLWVAPAALVLIAWVAWTADTISEAAPVVVLILVVAVLSYGVALRVRFMNLADHQARGARRASTSERDDQP